MPRPNPSAPLPPVRFPVSAGEREFDLEAIVRCGVAGHPIELRDANDCYRLFHAMDRMRLFGPYRLLRKQAGRRWLAYIVPVAEYRVIETAARLRV